MLAFENSADDAVSQPHTSLVFASTGSADKTMRTIKEATHYYAGQRTQLAEAVELLDDWLAKRFGQPLTAKHALGRQRGV